MEEMTTDEQRYPSLDEVLGEYVDEHLLVEDAVVPDAPILPEVVKNHIQNPPFIQQMLQKISDVDTYAWNRGQMGFDFGFDCLNKAFNGMNTGLMLIAGGANSGKSALLLKILWNVARKNKFINEDHPKMAFSLYFSLDDSNNELMPRIVASDQRITINQALYPKSIQDQPVVLEKREAGLANLRENVRYFAMHDANDGSSIEFIAETMKTYREQLNMMAPNQYRLAVFIDNFHDVTVDASGYSEDNARFDFISGRLNELAIEFDAPIMCSAEFRKNNTQKRPQEDDIKSTGKVTYESKGTILVYNEVGVKGDNADIYWDLEDANNPGVFRKMPVMELHIAKNKFNSYKGRQFLRFMPEMAAFFEVQDEESQRYQQMMRG